MAISKNMWLDGANQKLGGAVTYTLKGQQIIRKEAPKVANPRTTAQMNQRVRIANLVNFYRANRSWMKRGAFENKKQTQSDYNAFVSRNMQSARIALTKSEALAGAVIADFYQVTDGSLSSMPVTYANGKFSISAPGVSTATETIGALATALINSNLGIQAGDQLSFIFMVNKRDSNNVPRLQVYPIEVILNPSNTDEYPSIMDSTLASIRVAENTINITPQANAGAAFGLAVIVSRTTSTGIKVSPSWVELSDETFVTGYSSTEQFQKANKSYGESSANFLDSTSVVAGDSNTPSGGDDQGGSGSGDPGDVNP